MGKVFSHYVTRNIRNWNVENRAMKAIEKTEIDMAPKHPSTAHKIDQFQKDHPELLDIQRTKNDDLHIRLHGVHVSTQKIEVKALPSKLPQSKALVEDSEYGYLEPAVIPEGKCSVHQALHFISNYAASPSEFSVARIAAEYKLNQNQVEHVLKHFQMLWVRTTKAGEDSSERISVAATQAVFNVLLPKNQQSKAALAAAERSSDFKPHSTSNQ